MIHSKVLHGELISSMLHILALAKHSRVHKQELCHNVHIVPDSLNWCHFDPIDIYRLCVLNLFFIRTFLHDEHYSSIMHCFNTS